MKESLSIAIIGDISFMGCYSDKPMVELFSDVKPIFEESDIVIGNLESPLLLSGEPMPGKACLRGNPEWAVVLKEIGISIVSLANNHIMDYGEEGLQITLDSLKQSGIRYTGAGNNIEEAKAPIFFDMAGSYIGLLSRSSVDVKSHCYAERNRPGAAFLDISDTIDSINLCKTQSDLVILMVHWGVENYFYPSPKQRALARRFVDAGADVIIGHHPHVIQGIESFGKGIVAYSLGNFLFDDFEWQIKSQDGSTKTTAIRMNGENRNGMILQLQIDRGELRNITQIFTRISTDGHITVDSGKARVSRNSKISKRLKIPFYGYFWKCHSIKREWQIRLRKQIQFKKILKKLHKIRPHHIVVLIQNLKKSARITSGRSTNPYD